jgi:hypothetical protein
VRLGELIPACTRGCVALGLLSAWACGGNAMSATAVNQTPDFTVAPSLAGSWTGASTRAGDAARRLRFTVSPENVLTFLNPSFATPDCGGYGVDFAVASTSPITIVNGSFASSFTWSYQTGGPFAFTFTTATITGTFGSASSASGTITVQDYVQPEPAGCSSGTLSLTWNATKP